MDTIKLIGGPRDGDSIEWDSGDVAELIDVGGIPSIEPPELQRVSSRHPRPVRYLYRRSMVTPSIFVFQP